MLTLQRHLDTIERTTTMRGTGKVVQNIGLILESEGPPARLGELCHLGGAPGAPGALAEVVGFRDGRVLLMPLDGQETVAPGCPVVASGERLQAPVGSELLGRVLDGLGRPIDGRGPIRAPARRDLEARPPHPLRRQRIRAPFATGIRALDGLVACGQGQRLGIFAGSGVGKSILLGMMARGCQADVNVIALIGERGREIREFVERDLGPSGLRNSVVVAATSDHPALARLKGAFLATTIAEYFRDLGQDVLLVMDSLTRVAMAQREIGLAAGEPPATRGYPPSAFALLPKLLERSGTSERGSITGIFTVLVEGDDFNEPVADAARSILDGHVVLSRKLASENHYPAVDVLASVSRVMVDLVDREHLEAAATLRRWLAAYREAEDLIQIGAYARGSNPTVDEALDKMAAIRDYLRQDLRDRSDFATARAALIALAAGGTA